MACPNISRLKKRKLGSVIKIKIKSIKYRLIINKKECQDDIKKSARMIYKKNELIPYSIKWIICNLNKPNITKKFTIKEFRYFEYIHGV
jgi:hypothetical protein